MATTSFRYGSVSKGAPKMDTSRSLPLNFAPKPSSFKPKSSVPAPGSGLRRNSTGSAATTGKDDAGGKLLLILRHYPSKELGLIVSGECNAWISKMVVFLLVLSLGFCSFFCGGAVKIEALLGFNQISRKLCSLVSINVYSCVFWGLYLCNVYWLLDGSFRPCSSCGEITSSKCRGDGGWCWFCWLCWTAARGFPTLLVFLFLRQNWVSF